MKERKKKERKKERKKEKERPEIYIMQWYIS